MWARVRSVNRLAPWIAGATSSILMLYAAAALPGITWLPASGEARPLLLGLLGAQAAITALTLAVALFVLQAVAARRDADDRTAREYLRGSHVRWIFPSSIVTVTTTGATFLLHEFGNAGMPILADARGLPNVTLVAALAFLANMALSGWLFERALSLASPAAWRQLRREVNERDVRSAVRAFVERQKRLSEVGDDVEQLRPELFPGAEEGSADEAVRALLDDARRAMDERRTAEFGATLASIQDLLTQTMVAIERAGIDWSAPGPTIWSWPPLGELSRRLFDFRAEVIRRGEWEYVRALDRLDRWMVSEGLRRRCGEIFTAGIDGYRQNYAIAIRARSSELREYYCDRVWWAMRDALRASGSDPEDSYPYLREAVRHQEGLLGRALEEQLPHDFRSLHGRFAELLRFVGQGWRVEDWPRPDSADLHESLETDARVALLGLAGRALELEDSGKIPEPDPYLAVVREEYGDPQRLADDAAHALSSDEYLGLFSWLAWQGPATLDMAAQSVDPPRYVLSFAIVRLLELASGSLPDLDLHGAADQVLRWCEANAGRLERHVRPALPDPGGEARRREAVREALEAAVRRDAVTEEDAIIARPLSAERVQAFVADVYASRFIEAIEHVFTRAGAFLYLPEHASEAPHARGSRELVPKAPFTDTPEGARVHYASIDGDPWADAARDDVVEQLRAALSDAPPMKTIAASPEGLRLAMDDALSELAPAGDVLVLLVGDWSKIIFELDRSERESEGGWAPYDADRLAPGVSRWYRGHPIIWRQRNAPERHLYMVEPGAWGCFVRAQTDGGRDLIVDVEAISDDRARTMLKSDTDYFPDQPDDVSKLRKLRGHVVVGVAGRASFGVLDFTRARRATGGQ